MNHPTFSSWIVAILIASHSYVLAQEISLDLWQDYSIHMQTDKHDKGASIHLSTQSNEPFLRLHSYELAKDLEFPHISRSVEYPLVIGTDDGNFQEQLRIEPDGDVVIQNLSSTTTRNIVADENGKLKLQTVGSGYSGIQTIHTFDFVAWSNPGDDHNWTGYTGGTMYHEPIDVIGSHTEILVAPIRLPHGATIRKIEAFYHDNNASANRDISFEIDSRPILNNTPPPPDIVIGQSSGAMPGIRSIVNNSLNLSIDNANFLYHIHAFNPHEYSNWGGESIGVRAVTIYYD